MSQAPAYVARLVPVPFRLPPPVALGGRAPMRLPELGAASTVPELLARVTAARRALGVPAGEPVGDDPTESEANRDNDLAFGIVRVRGDEVALLADGALAAWAALLELAVSQGVGIPAAQWRALIAGFEFLLGYLADPRQLTTPAPAPLAGPAKAPQPEDALRRWVRGHHVFMVFAQGGALAVDGLRAAAERGDEDEAVVAAGVATGLLHACEGALRYAGHANSEQYLGEIRPTLTPPVAPPKMSGLHWRDHEALIGALQTSADAWQWLGARRPGLLRGFRAALSDTYVAHGGVCEHFVGTEAPSLLAAQGSSRSAVGVLAQFRRIRLAALPDPDAGADPSDPGTTTPKEAHSHVLDA